MKQTKAFLISKKFVSSDVGLFSFYVENEGFSFTPGQYTILTIPSSTKPLKRLYSFAGSSGNNNVFELLIKHIPGGLSSEYLKKMCVGETIEISGPAGLFTQKQTPARKIYMATGTGYAPIRSFLLSEGAKSVKSTLYWGIRDLSETYLFDELLSLKNSSPSFSFAYCLSQQKSFDSIPAYLLHYYRSGRIDAVWRMDTPLVDIADEYYLCGSRTVIDSLQTLLLSRGVLKDHLFFEKY